MNARAPTRLVQATAPRPGAVAILQLVGPSAIQAAEQLADQPLPRDGRMVLRRFGDIDEGLAGVLRGDTQPIVQLMPHGGPRVVQKITEALVSFDATPSDDLDACDLFPEASTALEADMLLALAETPSPAAIDLLAAQPALWREWLIENDGAAVRLDQLPYQWDQLLYPPSVVVVGRPNVGKSTLTNTLLGRAVSIVSDLPGTTRDWVGSLAELGPPRKAVAVRWLDTPGLRDSGDTVEQHAIELARRVVAQADVLIAMRDPEHDWPELDALPRRPDLWVLNKCDALGSLTDITDQPGCEIDHPLPVSALHDAGVTQLSQLVVDTLGLGGLSPRRWAFSPTLRAYARGESVDLAAYLQADA